MHHPAGRAPRRALPPLVRAPALLLASALVLPALVAGAGAAPAAAAPLPAPVEVPVEQATTVLYQGDPGPLPPLPGGTTPRATTAGGPTLVPAIPAPPSSDWRVEYVGAFPSAARASFQRAVDLWAAVVRSPVPITVRATMPDLRDPRLLGETGPTSFWSGVGDGRSIYPVALGNALARYDLDTRRPDMESRFNLGAPFYYGADGRPGPGQIDFETVVLHELGHGLGFLGAVDVDDAGRGTWYGEPAIFDRFTASAAGPVLSQTDGSVALADQLRSGTVRWTGTGAVRRNGGTPPALFAPPTWQPGSSYAHLDENAFGPGSPESLMTPYLDAQEVIRDPGSITRGILADMGWSVVQEPAQRGIWSSAPGQLDVAETRPDGQVALRTMTPGGLSQPELLGGLVRGAPAVVRRPSGALEVYVRGGDDQLHVRRRPQGGAWTPWTALGGVITGPPGVSLFGGDDVHVFVRGGDEALHHRWSPSPGVYSVWERLGGRIAAGTGPSAVTPAPGRLDVVVQGADGAGYSQSYAGRWNDFVALGGALRGSPAVAAPGGTTLMVVRGTDDKPYTRTVATGWAPLGGALVGSPVVASAPGSTRLDLLVTGSDGGLYANTRTGTTWSGWSVA